MIGSHYSLYLIPSIFISLAYTLRKIKAPSRQNTLQYILLASIISITVTSPISPVSTRLNSYGYFLWYPDPCRKTETTLELHALIDLIPGDASVLTQNHIFPHVSCRTNAYLIPARDFNAEQSEVIEGYIDWLIDKSDVVLIDMKVKDVWTIYTLKTVEADPSFRIGESTDDAIMFTRAEKD